MPVKRIRAEWNTELDCTHTGVEEEIMRLHRQEVTVKPIPHLELTINLQKNFDVMNVTNGI